MEAIIYLIVYLISIPLPAIMGWNEVKEIRTVKRVKDIHGLFDRPATKWDLVWRAGWCILISILPLVNSVLTAVVGLMLFFEKLWDTKFIKWMQSPL